MYNKLCVWYLSGPPPACMCLLSVIWGEEIYNFLFSVVGKEREVETERAFVCRMKCILNTSAGFFKVWKYISCQILLLHTVMEVTHTTQHNHALSNTMYIGTPLPSRLIKRWNSPFEFWILVGSTMWRNSQLISSGRLFIFSKLFKKFFRSFKSSVLTLSIPSS